MPFSRASACIASRISLDIGPLLLDQIRAANLRVGNRHETFLGGERDLGVGSADELAGVATTTRGGGGAQVGGHAARATAGAATDEAAEVVGLGQRTLQAGRGDLQRVALAEVAERGRDALAECERDALGVVDEHAQGLTAE